MEVVLERDDRMVVGIEVKAIATVRTNDSGARRRLRTVDKNLPSASFFTTAPMSRHSAIGSPQFPFPAYGDEIGPSDNIIPILTILR
ncbi:hypothetical protein HJA84_24815 [Rhizobium bangladeshense]|nr:hypothetical protein [Rhizobium bangladeshense]